MGEWWGRPEGVGTGVEGEERGPRLDGRQRDKQEHQAPKSLDRSPERTAPTLEPPYAPMSEPRAALPRDEYALPRSASSPLADFSNSAFSNS